jgi:hypothetical protein
MKTLDMADKYPPADDDYAPDSTPTIRVQVPEFLPKAIVSDEGEEVYDLDGGRDTIPSPPPNMEKTYPGVGLLMTLGFGLIFWSTIAYFIFR